jgi:hypothetical protein
MRIPLWIKLLWTAGVIAWVPVYWRQYGPQNFLFFCDLGNVLITFSSVAGKPADIFMAGKQSAVFPGFIPRPRSAGALSGQHSLAERNICSIHSFRCSMRLLSLFHVVTPPLLLWAIWRLGYDQRGWKYQTVDVRGL